jgi:hypothetical protein
MRMWCRSTSTTDAPKSKFQVVRTGSTIWDLDPSQSRVVLALSAFGGPSFP